jgi:hypothetical protein
VGEGILDGDVSGDDAAGEILLRVGMQMFRRSVRASGERDVELEHGGTSHITQEARDRWRRRNAH